ncbi:MAG: thioredoxin family protein, partial [Planctomycetaceae bacterium]|nr:thioredoxin family protein [Planctomycetaceae bacterium]
LPTLRLADSLRSRSSEVTMSKAVFYHAGCPVCVSAEHTVADALKSPVEKVHLGEAKGRVAEAEKLGVKSVPALVIDGQVFHINHGADLSVLK